eukprot:gene2891-3593_t
MALITDFFKPIKKRGRDDDEEEDNKENDDEVEDRDKKKEEDEEEEDTKPSKSKKSKSTTTTTTNKKTVAKKKSPAKKNSVGKTVDEENSDHKVEEEEKKKNGDEKDNNNNDDDDETENEKPVEEEEEKKKPNNKLSLEKPKLQLKLSNKPTETKKKEPTPKKENKKGKVKDEKEEEEEEEGEEELNEEENVDFNGIEETITDPVWKEKLSSEFSKPYFKTLIKNLNDVKKRVKKDRKPIYPPRDEIFSAFNYTPYDKVKVVIIGQDPYHGPGQAHGLSFSVKKGIAIPPSLINIYKELQTDIPGFKKPNHGYLASWAQQGVFMLNAALTVEKGTPNAHQKFGWYTFTDQVIRLLNNHPEPIVFVLWGKFAQDRGKLITNTKHTILQSGHPSPMSVKLFTGCKHFSQVNKTLEQNGLTPIDWKIEN